MRGVLLYSWMICVKAFSERSASRVLRGGGAARGRLRLASFLRRQESRGAGAVPFALREIEGGTGARRGTPTTNPVSHFQLPHPVVGAIRESPVPPQREPPIPPPLALADPRTPSPHRRGNPRGCPGPLRKSVHPEPVEGPSATNSTYRPALPQIVVPAEAGTQGRCAARRRLRPPSFLRPTSRHSCEGRNPEGPTGATPPTPFALSPPNANAPRPLEGGESPVVAAAGTSHLATISTRRPGHPPSPSP